MEKEKLCPKLAQVNLPEGDFIIKKMRERGASNEKIEEIREQICQAVNSFLVEIGVIENEYGNDLYLLKENKKRLDKQIKETAESVEVDLSDCCNKK